MAVVASGMTNVPPAAAPGTVQSAYGGPDINSVVLGLVDRRPWQYWDTFTWTLQSPAVAIPSEVALFTLPINAQDSYAVPTFRKTKLQTNMTNAGMFNAPECLILQQIGIYIPPTNLRADIDRFFENCWMEFKINQKIFMEGQPWQFPAGVGYTGAPNPTGGAADTFIVNGFPAPQATRRFGSFSKYIAPLQPFSLKFFFPTGNQPTFTANFKLVVFLDGLADTVVQ
jgi:hypothetical protein